MSERTVIRPDTARNRAGATWRRLGVAGGGISATMVCPNCNQPSALLDHVIAPDGTVYPSVECPNDDCTFHEFVLLEGWGG